MPIQDGKRLVNDLVTDSGKRTAETPATLRPFLPEVQKRTQQPGAVFYDCLNTCKNSKGYSTGYDQTCHEIQMWHIGLMFAEYVAGLVADKARDGHCHAEGKTNPRCSMGRDLHLKMLARFKHDLSELIEEIAALENEAPSWPKAEAHPVPQSAQQS